MGDAEKLDPMRDVLLGCRGYFVSTGVFSLFINLLYLAPTVYMYQVSDRVMTSGSIETLAFLTLGYVVALATIAALEVVRARVLVRAGLRIDRLVTERLMPILFERANLLSANDNRLRDQPLRALDGFRQFATGSGVLALFDLPWLPIYLVTLFLLHFSFGMLSLVFMVLQLLLTVLTELFTSTLMAQSERARVRSYGMADTALRNAEVVMGMGMAEGVLGPWSHDRRTMLHKHALASDRNALLSTLGRFLRLLVQALIVGLGAYLAIQREVSPGTMFAAMLLIGRATQPLDQVVAAWKSILATRQSFRTLRQLLAEPSPRQTAEVVPVPVGTLTVEQLAYVPPGARQPVLAGVSLHLTAGGALGVIGPSAAGKSTFARLLVGVHRPTDGAVRLDGANVYTWERTDFGRHVGYLPQDIELFAGSVSQNISRFRPCAPEDIINAARLAGAHEMILNLARGYETPIGEAGVMLSGGQRQMIGLARAVFGNPRLVVLDEPNSNLDSDGEMALSRCLQFLKQTGVTVVLISHRPAVLQQVDDILYLHAGRPRALIPRAEFLAQMRRPTATQVMPA
jgi:PrtD family type I secretion system ABC transporter